MAVWVGVRSLSAVHPRRPKPAAGASAACPRSCPRTRPTPSPTQPASPRTEPACPRQPKHTATWFGHWTHPRAAAVGRGRRSRQAVGRTAAGRHSLHRYILRSCPLQSQEEFVVAVSESARVSARPSCRLQQLSPHSHSTQQLSPGHHRLHQLVLPLAAPSLWPPGNAFSRKQWLPQPEPPRHVPPSPFLCWWPPWDAAAASPPRRHRRRRRASSTAAWPSSPRRRWTTPPSGEPTCPVRPPKPLVPADTPPTSPPRLSSLSPLPLPHLAGMHRLCKRPLTLS